MTDALHVTGVPRDATDDEALAATRRLILDATDDLAWLSRGQRVLIKLAMNSPDPYPATSSPVSLRAVVSLLQERGADVIVGDMPGMEYVLMDESGSKKRSSRYCYEGTGMGAGVDAPFQGFEEAGWEDGFVHKAPEGADSWPDGFHLTRLVDEVDHVIALPRLSTHTQGGVTLGYKIAVGYLRHDSRMEFHRDGPFYSAMKHFARQTTLPTKFTNGHRFFEKIVEIHLAVRPKQRLTLLDGRQAQVTFGPDQKVPPLGIRTKQVTPDTGLLVASANGVATEVFGIANLIVLYQQLAGCGAKFLQKCLMLANRQQKELGKTPPWEHRFVRHALALGLDRADFETVWSDVPDPLREALHPWLTPGVGVEAGIAAAAQ